MTTKINYELLFILRFVLNLNQQLQLELFAGAQEHNASTCFVSDIFRILSLRRAKKSCPQNSDSSDFSTVLSTGRPTEQRKTPHYLVSSFWSVTSS